MSTFPSSPSRVLAFPPPRPRAKTALARGLGSLGYALGLSASLLLAACSGGGSVVGGSSSVAAFLSKGPITDAECTLYSAGNVKLAGPAKSSAGKVSFGTVSGVSSGSTVYASCTGGTYTDEATGTVNKANDAIMRGVAAISGSETTVVITPLTETAFQKAGGDATKVKDIAAQVATAMGISGVDILTTIPTDISRVKSAGDSAGKYGVLLAALSQMQKNSVSGTSTNTGLVTTLVNGIIDAAPTTTLKTALDTATAAGAATTSINGNDNVKTNVAGTTLTVPDATTATLYIDSATTSPASPIKQGKISSGMSLAGVGFAAPVTLTLNGTACTGSGTVASATSITGIDCSNVTLPNTASVTLVLTSNSKSAQYSIALTDAPAPTLTWSSGTTKSMVVGETFVNTASISSPAACTGAITYSSSDTTKATVNATSGAVSAVAVGSATITATSAAVAGVCAAASTTYSVTINARPINTVSGLPTTAVAKTYGDADFQVVVADCADTSTSPTTYEVTGSGLAVEMPSGVATSLRISGANTAGASVKAICPVTSTRDKGEASYTVTIAKATPTLTAGTNTAQHSVTMGNTVAVDPVTVTGVTPAGGTQETGATVCAITYTSSNTSVATVSGTIITPVAAGSTIIRAACTGTANYNNVAASTGAATAADYTLTVKPAATVSLLNNGAAATASAWKGVNDQAIVVKPASGTFDTTKTYTLAADGTGNSCTIASGDVTTSQIIARCRWSATATANGNINLTLSDGTISYGSVAITQADPPQFIKIASTGYPLADQGVAWAHDGDGYDSGSEVAYSKWDAVLQTSGSGTFYNVTYSDGFVTISSGDPGSWRMWEMKTKDATAGLRDVSKVYTNETSAATGNALQFAADVNALSTKVAGKGDWRLPIVNELVAIYGTTDYSTFFANAQSSVYWSGSSANSYAWTLKFTPGGNLPLSTRRNNTFYVRLVRTGQTP
jgi:hypothetical protein